MAPIIASSVLLLVATDLVEFAKGHGPSNLAHTPILKNLGIDRGGSIGERGCRGSCHHGCHFYYFHPGYVGLLAAHLLVRNSQDEMVMVLGFLLWDCVSAVFEAR